MRRRDEYAVRPRGANVTTSGTACYDCTAGPGACDVCDGSVCHEAPFCLADTFSLPTNAIDQGNGGQGAVFNVRAINALTITGFEITVYDPETTIDVYTKVGSYRTNAPGVAPVYLHPESAWTFVARVSVTRSLGAPPYSPYSSSAVVLPASVRPSLAAGEVHAFYLRSLSGNLAYQTASAGQRDAVVASDANLEFFSGAGFSGHFPTSASNFPRTLFGEIRYVLPGTDASLATTSEPYEGDVADGVMFDVTASSDADLFDALEVELAAGTHDVDVYMRRGSFIGAEGTHEGWVRIGGGAGLVSAGGGALTRIALSGQVALSTGETIALYIDTHGTGLRTSAGASVGAPTVSSPELTVHVGSAIDAAFGGIGPAATVRAKLTYDRCL